MKFSWGFPSSSAIKNLPDNAGDIRDMVSISGKIPGGGNGTHSSILAWRIPWREKPGGLYVVHGVAKCQTQLSY